MTYSFVADTLQLHNRNDSRLFVAYDGRGSVDDYRSAKCIFSSSIQANNLDVDFKFLDMLVAIHGDFFVMNPRSTFSFQIYIIRSVLGLSSVPMVKNNDFYLQRVPEDLASAHRPLWVSWLSIYDALVQSHGFQ
jgi:hypothetical protein